ncbi:MAG: S41 family peptidase [Bacteroidota bacterium]
MMKKYALFILSLCLSPLPVFGQTTVTFQVNELPKDDLQHIGIRGNIPPLDWGRSILLKGAEAPYYVTLEFPESDESLEFKFVRFNDDSKPTWESTQNRTLELIADTVLISNNRWNREQIVDISTLKKLTPEGLSADYKLIETMVLDVHPGTYRYNDHQQIKKGLNELKAKFSQPLTHGEAYLAISKVTAQIKCDHTKAGFNNQSKIINSVIHYQKDKLPFTFKWVGDQMLVIQNASQNNSLKKGIIINSINGIKVKDIQQEMMTLVGADGATDHNRLYKTEINGYDFRYNAFDIFFPLLYPFSDSLTLDIQDYKSGATQTLKVAPLTREERSAIFADRYADFPKTRDDLWNFEILENQIGLLTVNSFGLFGWKAMTLDYKQFLADTFAKLNSAGIKHLIIDIRKNNGGADEMLEELFGYLSKENSSFNREGRTRYLEFPESLKPYVQTWGDNPWYFNLQPKKKKPTDGYYIFKENFTQKTDQSKMTFSGDVYLLTSAANTSLAFYTAYRFQKQEMGLSIGQETGGNLNDINGGQILFLRLPYSQIEIDFPVMGGFTIEPQPDMGVKPDIEIEYTIEDIIAGRDLEIETALKMIADKQ